MKNIGNFSGVEKELLLELEYILVNHRYKCSILENITDSNAKYMYRIKKSLLKSKSESKRIAALKTIISSVNIKINRGMLFKEIFEPLPAIIEQELKNNSKKDSKQKENENEKKKIEIITKNINEILNYILSNIGGCAKKELQQYESDYINNIRVITSAYDIVDADKGIFGCINTGLMEDTRKSLIKDLYDNYRIKLKNNDKLSDRMSDELLRYRVAVLIYTNTLCNHRYKQIRPGVASKINYDAFEDLKEDIYFLGKVAREKYIDEYGISPKEEIIMNSIAGQMCIEGLMKKRDNLTRKRDLK